ncbi:Ubiquinol oxidase [Quillaja saponaria]|uniref:Ubiquinol oxidase n=1 Tax=Quillaja saponaria TaxID=32244 RepID=A0AAD7VNL2_QUISA|nr:Ubiquinol oxidase [Quillaja saponaria]
MTKIQGCGLERRWLQYFCLFIVDSASTLQLYHIFECVESHAYETYDKFLKARGVFMSFLHLYESFGWWRKADYLKVHFAESWNEMHHLLIMKRTRKKIHAPEVAMNYYSGGDLCLFDR